MTIVWNTQLLPACLREGVSHLCRYCGWQEEETGLLIYAEPVSGHTLTVQGEGDSVRIRYPDRTAFFRGLGLAAEQRAAGSSVFCLREERQFLHAGVMFDHSRNAVFTVERTRDFLCLMALMGLDVYYPYLEDLYTLPQEPLFGYLRGRYTEEEVRAIDDFADSLGIEVVPCIQTLAHLNQFLRWDQPAADYLDLDDILLVGSEKTGALIDEMFRFFAGAVRSRRIHVGMDEAYHLGRGRYADENGLKKKTEIMHLHLRDVITRAQKAGLAVMMWDDMFSGTYHPLDGQALPIPEGAQLVYWDYYHDRPEEYAKRFTFRKKLCQDLVFAGGAWRWQGPAPHHNKTLATTQTALSEAKKAGIQEVFVTCWGDDGDECPPDGSYLGMQLFAEHAFSPEVSLEKLKERLTFCTGVSLSATLHQQDINFLPGEESPRHSEAPCKYLLYQDPLCGLYEEHAARLDERYDLTAYYRQCREALREEDYRRAGPHMLASLRYYQALSQALSTKWDLGLRIRQAYQKKDRQALSFLLHEKLPAARADMEALRQAAVSMWYENYKPFGLEALEFRFSALIGRMKTAESRLSDYLSGRIDSLPECEESRIPVLPQENQSPNSFQRCYSAARLSW